MDEATREVAGIGALRIEYRSVEELAAWPRNPKDHDVGALSDSFRRFGYVAPVLVDEGTGCLVAGHGRVHTLRMWRDQRMEPPPGVRVAPDGSWHVPVIRGHTFRDAAEVEAYMVADNRLTEVGGWNDAKLAVVLADLAKHGRGEAFNGTGFDARDLNRLLDRVAGTDAKARLEGQPHGGALQRGSVPGKKPVVCPECGHEWVP